MNDLISIITPCYNGARFIEQAIDSVLAQTYPHWEMIIVNDGSTDDSATTIAHYAAKDARIKTIELDSNTGAGQARNSGTKIAKGRYIAFLDSDDWWVKTKLETQLSFMQAHNLAFTYTSYQLINLHNQVLGEFITKKTVDYFDLLKTNSIGCSTVMYDAQKLRSLRFSKIARQEDYVVWLKVLKQIKTAQAIVAPLTVYRVNCNSLLRNKISAAIYHWQIYRKNERLSLFKSWYYFAHYSYCGLVKCQVCRHANKRNTNQHEGFKW